MQQLAIFAKTDPGIPCWEFTQRQICARLNHQRSSVSHCTGIHKVRNHLNDQGTSSISHGTSIQQDIK